MHTTVAILLEAPVSVELVDMARKCVDQIDKDLARLNAGLAKFKKKMKEIVQSQETTASGSGTSHK